jgi:hypothetical protein
MSEWPRPEPRDPTENLGEQRSRHRHFGQLERDVAAVADDSRTDLDQLLAQGGERPLLDLLRQRWRAQEVGEIVSERVQLEAYSVCRKAWQDSRVQRSAFLPTLIHCSAVPRLL